MSHLSFSSLRVRLFLLVLLAMVPVTETNAPSSAKPSENGGGPPSATNETNAPATPTQPA